MTKLKIHVREIERNHDGYCSETGIDDVYDKSIKIIVTEIETPEPIPQEKLDEEGKLKEEHWYDYVWWKKEQLIEDVFYEHDITDRHCTHCCRGTGYIYDIFKVDIFNFENPKNGYT